MPRDDGAEGGRPGSPLGASTEGDLGQFPVTRTDEEGVPHDIPEGKRVFTAGQVLGDRYQIHSQLGRGGMGEVWRAFDLKLRVEVALKALHGDLVSDGKRRESLRREVRAAREVVSPNVCRIFDLIEADGRELVSMEYVDGGTLLEVLQERGPLDLQEAQDIASQFLAGLEAIHQAGLVHRDLKPENIMVTRSGRVVLMDFGLARQEDSGTGKVAGTPAYMAPEQAAGLKVDARADVYSAGVVLAEMVSPEGIKNLQSRQSVWEGIRQEPARVPDSHWAPVLEKAVAKEPDNRYNSAHTLTRALEDVTLQVEGAEDLAPYPGLASFTEEDAEYFFGREAEIEAAWRRLEGAHLLAIVGPSGAGKSSFIAAGLVPNAPPGWAIVHCTPGNAAISSLARAMDRETAGDAGASEMVGDMDNPAVAVELFSRWRRRHDQVLLIVDQFEELFTQNTAGEQGAFTDLLGRLALKADVRVLLSMRDDFLMHCNRHESLKPIFSELTPLDPPVGPALRRALVQPAMKCGYRFEDDKLVDEMLAEVEGERGALPLLAFAMSRLWVKRDHEKGLITRRAYHDIGGVGGALARHAEKTIDRIGSRRVPVVRELFRNLVTAEGTRAVREWNELLSVFDAGDVSRAGIKPAPTKEMAAAEKRIVGAGFIPARKAAEEVLRELIDARLLTSYEVREEDQEPTRRVEIIHESLLANWPRLVRWQTQDADAAQLRDQLRQAARTWDEHERSDDLLWTGSAFREFSVWREGYPGGLTDTEEAFGNAMTALAGRRKRRRRVVVAAAFALLLSGLTVVGSFWQRSVRETRRAEAQKLLALAQVQIATDPTEALAYATSSLELADTHEARIFAVRALSAGPPLRALVMGDNGLGGSFKQPVFSPDGQWVALTGFNNEFVVVWNEDGGDPIVLDGHAVSAYDPIGCGWTRDGLLVTGHWTEGRVRIWEIPTGRLVRTIKFPGPSRWRVGNTHLLAVIEGTSNRDEYSPLKLRRWKIPDGPAEDLGSVDLRALGASSSVFDPDGNAVFFARGDAVFRRGLPVRRGVPDTLVTRHSSDGITFDYRGPGGFFSRDRNGEIIIWISESGKTDPVRRLREPENATTKLRPAPRGRWAIDPDGIIGQRDGKRLLWDLQGLPGARPIELRRSGGWLFVFAGFHPAADWVASSTKNGAEISFWPLQTALPTVVEGYDTFWRLTVGFTPDGRFLVSNWGQDRVRLWPLPGSGDSEFIDLKLPHPFNVRGKFAVSPKGLRILSPGRGGSTFLLSRSGEDPLQLSGFPVLDAILGGAFSPGGNLVAAATLWPEGQPTLRVWDVETGDVLVFDVPQGALDSDAESSFQNYEVETVVFADEATLYTSGAAGLLRWDLEARSFEQIIEPAPNNCLFMSTSADRRKILTFEAAKPFARRQTLLHDLVTKQVRQIEFPTETTVLSLGPTGTTWVAGEEDGLIRVGRFDESDAHVLAGHRGPVKSVAISPDRKWIASSGEDKTLRLWPMPDLSKPPLHTLPHDELIAKLKTLTNLRVVRDEGSPTGWKLEAGPFPGWETVPSW